MCLSNVHLVTFWVLPTRYSQAAAPVFTLNALLGISKNEILHFDSIFLKNGNFRAIFGDSKEA